MSHNNPLLKNNVQVTGKPDAPQTIVFGNGFGTDTTSWQHVVPSFAKDFRIVTYDNVGGGKSDPSAFVQSRYMHLHSYALDLIAIGEALQLRDVIYVGHSVSGMIGLLASKKAPHLFSKMVFMNASPRYLNDGAYVGGFEKQDLMELYRLMASNYYAWARGFAANVMGNADKPQLANEFARTLSEVRPDIALAVAKAIFESDHRADLKGFNIQSLIIQSTKDIAVPLAVGDYLHQHLAGSTLKVIDAEGHFPHISAPQRLILELKSFIGV
jgi:sigma-B regulation protein RsbQ